MTQYMYKITALCIASYAAFCAQIVSAQTSSVQLSGVVDASAYHKQLAGESAMNILASGGMTTSRWGLSGREDLGGGLSAIFDLSSFIRIDSGDSGRSASDNYWGRFAYTGLSSTTFGTLRLGRISTATFVSEVSFGAFQDSTTFGPYLLHTFLPSASQPMMTGNGYLDSAWNKSVAYYLPEMPSLPGLTGSLQFSPNDESTGRRLGGGLTYRNKSWGATLTFDRVDGSSFSVGAPNAGLATAGRPIFDASKVRTYQGGAYYDWKVIKLMIQANQTKFSNASENEIRLRTYSLSASVPVGAGSFLFQWARTTNKQSLNFTTRRNTVSIGYDHFLSKRTDLYLVAMHDSASYLKSGTGFAFGIRHRF